MDAILRRSTERRRLSARSIDGDTYTSSVTTRSGIHQGLKYKLIEPSETTRSENETIDHPEGLVDCPSMIIAGPRELRPAIVGSAECLSDHRRLPEIDRSAWPRTML